MNLAKDYFSEKYFFEEKFSKNFESGNYETKIPYFPQVFRRHHVLNDPINWVDPTGLKVYDPEGLVPSWIKKTAFYKDLDSSFRSIHISSGDLEGRAYGSTSSWAFGLSQDIVIDRNAHSGAKSNLCSSLTDNEFTRYCNTCKNETSSALLLKSRLMILVTLMQFYNDREIFDPSGVSLESSGLRLSRVR